MNQEEPFIIPSDQPFLALTVEDTSLFLVSNIDDPITMLHLLEEAIECIKDDFVNAGNAAIDTIKKMKMN